MASGRVPNIQRDLIFMEASLSSLMDALAWGELARYRPRISGQTPEDLYA